MGPTVGGAPDPAQLRRAAVVVNPTKLAAGDGFREAVCQSMRKFGWGQPMWLETTAGDAGLGLAREAVAAGVELVLACGGDGTVTSCAAGVAGTGVALAIVPMGTGNLLARNLGLPADIAAALEVGLTGRDQSIDAWTANGTPFLVMAGLGLDARMISDTSEPLKKRLGWAAYAVSVIRHLRDRPVWVTLTADSEPPVRLRSSALIVGNVGCLRGGVPLLPDARPDDGMLDAVALNARGWAGWLALTAQILRQRDAASRATRVVCRELVVECGTAQPWEIDGELMGTTTRLVIAAHPDRVLVRLPGE